MTNRTPRLSVIIVNLNTAPWLWRCLAALQSQDVLADIEVVVVDNASTDGVAEQLERRFDFCKLVRLEETVGFGQANNIGTQHATAPLMLFLNPDTEVHPGALGEMLERLETSPECGIAGGLIYDGAGNLERSTGSFPTLLSLAINRLLNHLPFAVGLLGRRAHQHWDGYDEPRPVDWVTGAYLWIRRELFDRLCGFDEGMFLYSEDTDLCFRARQLGSSCWYYPTGAITHHRNKAATPRDRRKMHRESLDYFARKHLRSPRFLATRVAFWLMAR